MGFRTTDPCGRREPQRCGHSRAEKVMPCTVWTLPLLTLSPVGGPVVPVMKRLPVSPHGRQSLATMLGTMMAIPEDRMPNG